jgi:hypothetical protein
MKKEKTNKIYQDDYDHRRFWKGLGIGILISLLLWFVFIYAIIKIF